MARRRPFRYTLILTSVALGGALAAAGGWRFARASAPLSGPIVVISVDTLRADHLPAYGYKQIKTPAIDALAADGVTFTRAYAHAPETLPAHVSLLSGRLPFETGVRGDSGPAVKRNERLLAQMLRDRGYATGGIVSASLLRKETGINQGFDFFDDDLPQNPEELTAGPSERDGGRSEEIAEHWLEGLGSARAFLFLQLNEPHAPYTPPDRFAQYSPYDGEIAYADEVVGRLVHFLKAHQMYDRSTIVLLSDHGEGLGDHGEQQHGLFVYDEAIHVPLIVKQEGNAGSGRRVADVVQHIDLVPTILDLVKAPVPGNLRGRSLKPLLEGSGPIPEPSVYSEAHYARANFGWSEVTALTGSRYRYIRSTREELYDLTSDAGERNNLAGQEVTALKTFSAELARVSGPVEGGAEPLPALADPKDKPQTLDTYRRGLDLVGDRKWSESLDVFQRVLRDAPDAPLVWSQLASVAIHLNRYDLAVDAYRHMSTLEPGSAAPLIGAADVLLLARRFDDAAAQATAAIEATTDKDTDARAAAHEILARVALARRDAAAARSEAALAQEAVPTRPLTAFVDARLLYEQGKYDDALPVFEKAVADSRKSNTSIPELHFYLGETLNRLERRDEALEQFTEEVRHFPENTRARASLATLYQGSGQSELADSTIADLLHASPTPEAYALAARLWRSFGKAREAEAVRAESKRLFGDGRARTGAAH